jgi:hypothetical protein
MNTRAWIEVIPEKNRKAIEVYSNLIAQATQKGLALAADEYAKKMRGYLECMKDCGIITEQGLKTLYLYYRSTRVDRLVKEAQSA